MTEAQRAALRSRPTRRCRRCRAVRRVHGAPSRSSSAPMTQRLERARTARQRRRADRGQARPAQRRARQRQGGDRPRQCSSGPGRSSKAAAARRRRRVQGRLRRLCEARRGEGAVDRLQPRWRLSGADRDRDRDHPADDGAVADPRHRQRAAGVDLDLQEAGDHRPGRRSAGWPRPRRGPRPTARRSTR